MPLGDLPDAHPGLLALGHPARGELAAVALAEVVGGSIDAASLLLVHGEEEALINLHLVPWKAQPATAPGGGDRDSVFNGRDINRGRRGPVNNWTG